MVDLSLLSDEELDQLEVGGVSTLSDDALGRVQGITEQKSGLQRASEFLGSNMELPVQSLEALQELLMVALSVL